MENVNINDDNVESLKAILCDVFADRIKDLTSIQDSEIRDSYIKLLGEITEEVEKLTEMIDKLDNLGFGKEDVTAVENVSSKSTSLEKTKTFEKDAVEVRPVNSPLESILPKVSKAEEETSDVEAKPVNVDDNVVPQIPNIFGSMFNKANVSNEEKASVVLENTVDSVSEKEATPVEESAKPDTSMNRDIVTPVVSNDNEAVVPDTSNNNEVVPIAPSMEEQQNNIPNEQVTVTPVIPFSGVVETSSNVNKKIIMKQSDDKTKAILVNSSQFEKLCNSKQAQEALLDFGNLTENKQSLEAKIEEMMARASSLYKEGKKDEAQDIYNQISLMNKENTLVKKSA